jgi:hypothetical protein
MHRFKSRRRRPRRSRRRRRRRSSRYVKLTPGGIRL